MKIKFTLLFLLTVSFAIQAQESILKRSTEAAEAPKAPRTSLYSFTEGTVGNKPIQIESSRIGGTTLSTGSLGQQPVNALTIQLDNMKLTTGTIGNESFEVITYGDRD